MKLLDISHSCLMDVLEKQIPFKLAVNNISKRRTLLDEQRKELTSIAGCSLRHFYVFESIINRLEKDFTLEQKVGLLIHLSNRVFVNVIPEKDVRTYLTKLDISDEDIQKINDMSSDKTKLIPEDVANGSIEYLHYRYNIPLWTLKMWMKHFKGYTYKIAKNINRPENHYAFVNSSSMKDEEVNLESFEKTDLPSLYLYKGNAIFNLINEIKSQKMMPISPSLYELLKELDLDVIRRIGLYAEVNNNFIKQLSALLSKNYHMDYIAGTDEAYYAPKKELDYLNLANVNIYRTGYSSIITCLSEKVHTMLVFPQNTNFAEFRRTPDYFLKVNSNDLDAYIKEQKESLLESANFVEDGGNLVYVVSTMNKKESLHVIEYFLSQRKDFSLVKHKQFFPFDKYDSTLYYAILRKENAND